MTEPDLLAKPAPPRDAAALRMPPLSNISGASPMAANLNRRANDDEFAVDAREVTRRPNVLSGGGASTPAAGPAAFRPPAALPKAGSGAANPPKLNVLYVSNGRIRAFGPQIWIRGTVEDDTDGIEVTINGQKAQVKDKSFQRRVSVPPGESDVLVRAEDADGNVTTSRFVLVRSGASQSLPAARPPAEIATPEYKLIEQPSLERVPRIEDVQDPGVYMVLMAGTPSAHFVKMPNLAQCREAVEYTENAACTFHRGRD
jgi:hypothetical protein